MRFYSGEIHPGENVVFVFGSNPEGRHGAGAAKVARLRFGAVYGQGEGLQGSSYALPTKDLRVKENRGYRSISPEDITENIRRMYECARQHPDKDFCIAYRNTAERSLNGYTGLEMIRMFLDAGPVPDNVVVSEEWHRTGLFAAQPRETEPLNTENSQKQHIMAQEQKTATPSWARYAHDGYEVSSAGDQRFSALAARFAEGTMLGDIDISGRTIEDVYQHVVKRSGKGQAPARDSILYREDLASPQEAEDWSYENGYLPLWTVWAQQHRAEVAYLRTITEGGRTLTDRFATTRVSQARALADIIAGNGVVFSPQEQEQWFKGRERHPEPSMLEGYDVYSIGTGKESYDDFWSKVPQDTTVIVDMRPYRRNTYYPHFDAKALVPETERRGLKYTWGPQLSGRDKDNAVAGMESKLVYDYGRAAATEEFRDGLQKIRSLVEAGEKVALISGEADPRFSPRALLFGQELEKTTGLHIGHIDRLPSGELRVRAQETVVRDTLPAGFRITEGDYRGLTFLSDRRFTAAPGTAVRRISLDAPESDRTIRGQWNYSTEVTFAEDDTAGRDATRMASALGSVFIRNAEQTDYSLVFTFNGTDRDTTAAIAASSYKNMKLSLPEHKEDYYDEALIERTATRIRKQMAYFLVYRYKRDGLKYTDIDNLKLNVEGANIARIANEYVQDPAFEGLSQSERSRMGNTGMKMDDITAINQDDVNHFITEVLRSVTGEQNAFRVADDAPEQPFRITEIRTSGQSGVAEAATVASQALGLKTAVLAPKGYRYTIDNETPAGRTISDRPSFENRFHQGLHNDISLRNLKEQIEELDYRRMVREDGMQTGLTDRQVLVLYNLGFSNTDIIDITELAAANAVSVNGPDDMEELLDRCAGYGIATSGILREDIVKAFETAAQQQARWKDEGITFISATSPYYPENLRLFKETQVQEYRTVETVTEDGAVTVSQEKYPVTEKRPALLWLKGDISLLQEPSVAVAGEMTTSKDTAAAARYVGSVLAQEDMPAVVALDGNAASGTAEEIISRGGRVIAVLPDGIKTTASDPDVRMAEIQDRVNEINAALGEFPEEERRDALTAERDALFDEADRLSRRDPVKLDAEKAVVDKGGLLASTLPPDTAPKDNEKRSLAAKVASGMGYACMFLNEMSHAQPMNPLVMAAYAVYGTYYLTYKGLSGLAVSAPAAAAPQQAQAQQDKDISMTEDDIRRFIDEARVRFDVGPEQALGQDAPAQAEGRERFSDRIASFFDNVFDEKTQVAAVQQEQEAAPQVSRLPVTVIHTTVPVAGFRDTYVVPEGHPQVESALRRRFGEDIRIITPQAEPLERDRLEHRTVLYEGLPVNRTNGYRGTQPLHPETYTTTVYFDAGRICTPLEMPNGAYGMLPLAERRRNAEAMADFVAACRAMQLDFQKDTGYRTALGPQDDFVQFRYENADYMVTRPDCVEIRRGDETRARVMLTTAGDIKVENFTIASDDLQEYHEIPTYKVFSNPPASPSREQLLDLVDEIRHTLETRGLVTQLSDSVMTREEQDERQQKLDNNFLREREDNLNIAMNDFATGQSMGLIPEEGAEEAVSRADLMAYAAYTLNGVERDIRKTVKDIAAAKKNLSTACDERKATLEAAADATTREEKDALNEKAKEMQMEADEYANVVGDLMAKHRTLSLRKADLEDLTLSLTDGFPYVCRKDKGKQILVDVGGVTMSVRTKALTQADRLKAAEALAAPTEAPAAQEQHPQELPQPSAMTSEEIDKEMAAHGEWLHENGEEGQEAVSRMERVRQLAEEKGTREAVPEQAPEPQYTVVSPYRNDVCIVETDEGQAYADRQMNIISESYHKLSPMEKRYGAAFNEEGRIKLINRDGTVAVDRWAKSYKKWDADGLYLANFGDGLNLFDTRRCDLLCDRDLAEIRHFDDCGMAVVRDTEGKYNFLKRDGGALLQTWCDGLGEFKDGKAVAVVGQTAYQIDRQGTILKSIKRDMTPSNTPSNGTGGPK